MQIQAKTIFSQEDTKLQLLLSEHFEAKVRAACEAFPNLEWSGAMFYTYEGTLGEPDFKLIAKDFLLQDVGNSVYTEYSLDGEVASYLADHLELIGCKVGRLHSHNTMATFFSGTDTATLKEQGDACNNVLSLIVNNKGDYNAKFTQLSKVQQSDSIRINTMKKADCMLLGDTEQHTSLPLVSGDVKEYCYNEVHIYDCTIQRPSVEADEEFKQECLAKKEEIEEAKARKQPIQNPVKHKSVWYEGSLFDDWGSNDDEYISHITVERAFNSLCSLSFSMPLTDVKAINQPLSPDFLDCFVSAWQEYWELSSLQLRQVSDKLGALETPDNTDNVSTLQSILEDYADFMDDTIQYEENKQQ